MTPPNLKTREKIIAAAKDLFSKFGYEGTSVRDIAQESGVNIASINYHFVSKEALYWEVFMAAHAWLESGLEQVFRQSENLNEFIGSAFDFLLKDKSYVRNSMKLMLSENISAPVPGSPQEDPIRQGIPGRRAISSAVAKGVERELSEKEDLWATKCILGSLVHWTVMCSTSKFEIMKESDPIMNECELRDGLIRQGQAVVDFLKKNTF